MDQDDLLDKSPLRVQRMFAGVAPRYDLLNRLLSLGIDRSWRRRTAAILLENLKMEGPVLDVCCGTGDLAFAFRQYEERRYEKRRRKKEPETRNRPVIGVDFVPEMLALAEKKRRRFPPGFRDNPEFREANALELPFEENRFAIVAVAFGLRNTQDPDRVLREMVRVGKPGGTVAVLEFSMPDHFLIEPLYRFYFRRILPAVGRVISSDRTSAYRYLPESVLQFEKKDTIPQRMRHAGLRHLGAVRMTFGIVSLHFGQCPDPTRTTGDDGVDELARDN